MLPAVLILHVCLAAFPDICKDERPVVTEPLNIVTCQLAGQQLGAEYVSDHPKWVFLGSRCEMGVRAKEKEI